MDQADSIVLAILYGVMYFLLSFVYFRKGFQMEVDFIFDSRNVKDVWKVLLVSYWL